MTLQEIKKAVDEGKVVHWNNESYQVIKNKGDYLIKYLGGKNSNYIGLTWQDGVTLNGEEEDFYIKKIKTMEDIIKGNKLIAEFMEIKDEENKYSHESSEYYFEASELEYNLSWDWLMPVVERIENTPNRGYGYEFSKKGKRCTTISDVGTGKDIVVENITTENTFLESTYKLVIKFIKWYNQNK